MRSTFRFALAWPVLSAAALTLGACDNQVDEDTPPVAEATIGDEVVPTRPMLSVVTLSPEQQQRRDRVDTAAYSDEFNRYVAQDLPKITVVADTSDIPGGNTTVASGKTGQTGQASPNAQVGIAGADSFEVLDRNNDGRLSVAEYAIYAIDLRPLVKKPNDQKPPYATADQLNRAADSFFYYDANGDSWLQPDEFQAAKHANVAART